MIRNQTGGAVAAIIVEPMQGTAGNVIPPAGFLSAIRDIAREKGALLIADEMITGFGRTGKMWGVDHDGVVPDVMTIGKGVGGGFPLSGVVSTDELTKSKPWSNPSGQLLLLRRQPARRRRGAGVARDHHAREPGRELRRASAGRCSRSSRP